MRKLSDIFTWYIMFNKRLLKKRSFIALLLLIPLTVSLATAVMSDEKSMLKIGLLQEDGDENAKAVIDSLLSEESALSYTLYTDRDVLIEDVKNEKIDSGWIFEENFTEKLHQIARKNKKADCPLTVIEREETVPQRIAQVKLASEVFAPLSKALCEEYVYGKNPSYDKLPKEEFDEIFEKYSNQPDIIELVKIGTYEEDAASKDDYLVSPVRGLLSVMVVLSALAACLYFLNDKASGKYQWLPEDKHLIPGATMCFSSALLSALTMLLTIAFSGLFITPGREIPSIIILVLSSAAFSFMFSAIFSDAGKFGAFIPALLIILVALSPIFFNVKAFAPIRFLLPTTYYLNSIYDPKYLLYGTVYTAAAFSLTVLVNNLKIKLHTH